MNKKLIYFDMDGVVADFNKHIIEKDVFNFYGTQGCEDTGDAIDLYALDNETFFDDLEIIGNAVDVINEMSKHFEIYFLSTPMWNIPYSYKSKRTWIEKHFGEVATKKLILSHNKSLLIGDYLIDDRTKNGAGEFKGEFIHFGQGDFKTLEDVRDYIFKKEMV